MEAPLLNTIGLTGEGLEIGDGLGMLIYRTVIVWRTVPSISFFFTEMDFRQIAILSIEVTFAEWSAQAEKMKFVWGYV